MTSENAVVFDKVKRIVGNAKHIVAIDGLDIHIECGGKDPWETDKLYEIEKTYGLSPEELLSAGEFSTRKDRFYKFYRDEVLAEEIIPSDSLKALKALEEDGRLDGVITFHFCGAEKLAGIENVVELYGSEMEYYCTSCGKKFTKEFVRNTEGNVPLCDDCKNAIRPNIRFLGERIRNDRLTQAIELCSSADVILVLGINLYGEKIQYLTGHYIGNKLILIKKHEHFTDKYADEVIYGKCEDILPKLIK